MKIYRYTKPAERFSTIQDKDITNNETTLYMRKPMTAKEKIIMFMEAKQKRLNKYGKFNYFNEKDAEAIKQWNETEAQKVWEGITDTIINNTNYKFNVDGLTADTCPSCNYWRYNCRRCEYGQNHGICTTNENSDYYQILIQLEEVGIEPMLVFSRLVYLNIINSIEKP